MKLIVSLAACLIALISSQASAQESGMQKTGRYHTVTAVTLSDGILVDEVVINGPPFPPLGFEFERQSVSLPQSFTASGINTLTVPAFNWVFGCSAVSGAMIAGYYDRLEWTNIYVGPTNGGVVPLDNSSWPTWSDGSATYPSCPLIASQNGVDGRATRGSIDDYWVQYNSSATDPYVANGWVEHTWGDAIGDYMKTSQSAYSNIDGSTTFYNWTTSASRLTCDDMVTNGIHTLDGTYGRKLFYEARGYTVTDCYNQKTDNTIVGGFSFAQFKAEIDAGRPVMLNLAGHTVVGVGYDDTSNLVYLHDTWDYNDHTMTWGGSYSGMDLQSVSIVNLETPGGTGISITVTSPNGGENWTAGTTHAITWSYTGSPGTYVKIELWKGGSLNRTIRTGTLTSSGSYNWLVPATQASGTDYTVKVTSTTNATYTDSSDANVTITGPTITVASPNGGENWTAGTAYQINWTYTGSPGTYVKIELYKGGVLNRTIAASVLTSAKTYTWNCPTTQASGTDYTVKVTSTTNATYTDSSDANFTITGPLPPSITVTSPNGGENWTAGTTHAITWSYTGSPGTYVKIELWKGGSLNRTIRTGTLTSSGSYNWLVPTTQASGTDYTVKVTSTTNATYTDSSDANFTITGPPPPTITVTSPNGGENWTAGTTHAITWSYTGSPGTYVKIELWKGGSLNRTIRTSALTSGGSYNWLIPATQISGNDYKIKITSTSTSIYTDMSDNPFSIARAAALNLALYQPLGWSDEIVVSSITGTTTDSSPVYATDTLYGD